MPDQARVEVSTSSIERAWEASGYDDFWLTLATDRTDDFALLQASVSAADDAAARDGIDLRGYSVTPSPGGFAVQIGPALERMPIRAWVQHFTDALQHHGLPGHLGGGIQAQESSILAAGQQPTPTLFARFALPPTVAVLDKARWEVGETQTYQAVRTALDWARSQPGEVILTQNLFSVQVEDGIDLQTHLERVLRAVGNADVDVADEAAQRARHAVLGPWAVALFQAIGGSWRDTVEELRDLATRLPPPLDLAFVRIAQRGIGGIHALDTVQPLPGIREHHVRYNQHLLDRYLPDAHGLQIVGDAHLNAAHDLSEWTVTDLGQGRHLVAARDLEPWYSAGLPDPDTLARARADWAGAILTEDVIAANTPG
jgi:hypothetical protein